MQKWAKKIPSYLLYQVFRCKFEDQVFLTHGTELHELERFLSELVESESDYSRLSSRSISSSIMSETSILMEKCLEQRRQKEEENQLI